MVGETSTAMHDGEARWGFSTTAILAESAAAASIGLINSVANLGGFAGPFFIGYLRTKTNSFTPGLILLLVCMVVSGLLALLLHVPQTRD